MPREITYTTYSARETDPYLQHLMMLRVRCLMTYPFLCMSSLAEERATSCPTTRLCIARCEDRIVGLAIGLALKDYNVTQEGFNAAEKFAAALGDDLSRYFLMSEIYVEPEYRHDGIGSHLIHELNELVASEGTYTQSCLLNLERDEEHPLWDENPYSLTELWERVGYEPTEISTVWRWPIRMVGLYGEYLEDCDNVMRLWVQPLKRQG